MPGSQDLPIGSLALEGWLPVVVARHGRTAANAERRLVGALDVPLDDTGRDQARALGRRLTGLRFQAAYTSPLGRARETLAIVLDATGTRVPIRILEDLAEWNQGVLEGRLERELAQGPHAALREAWRRDPTSVRIPGAEPLLRCQARARAALEAVALAHRPPDPVLVVGHQVALACALCGLVGAPLSELRAWTSRNTGLHVLGWRAGVWRVEVLDDAAHLGAVLEPVRTVPS